MKENIHLMLSISVALSISVHGTLDGICFEGRKMLKISNHPGPFGDILATPSLY